MSTDVLRIKLADAIEARRCSKNNWIFSSPLTKPEIASRIVNSVNNHLANHHSARPFRSSTSALRDDLRGLTLVESSFILESFESLQLQELQGIFPAFADVAIVAHEAEVIDRHQLLGKFAVTLLQLIDSE